MSDAFSKSVAARQEWISDIGRAILWSVPIGVPLFALHMVMLDFEHARHEAVQFSFGMSLSSIYTRHSISLVLWVTAVFIAALSVRRAFRRQEQVIAMRTLLARSQTQALTDGLTGVWNRRGLETLLEKDLSHAKISRCPFTILMADVDGLKRYNDTHGHLAADEALRTVVQTMKGKVRSNDAITRYGGDEFVILCPDMDHVGAKAMLTRLQEAFASAPVSVSFGTAVYPADGETTRALLAAADHRLYEAKSQRKWSALPTRTQSEVKS